MSDPTPGAPPSAPATQPVVIQWARHQGSISTSGNWLLDLVVAGGSIVIVGYVLHALLHPTKQAIDPAAMTVIASSLAAIIAIVSLYAGFRWGASDAMKKMAAQMNAGQGGAQ